MKCTKWVQHISQSEELQLFIRFKCFFVLQLFEWTSLQLEHIHVWWIRWKNTWEFTGNIWTSLSHRGGHASYCLLALRNGPQCLWWLMLRCLITFLPRQWPSPHTSLCIQVLAVLRIPYGLRLWLQLTAKSIKGWSMYVWKFKMHATTWLGSQCMHRSGCWAGPYYWCILLGNAHTDKLELL